MCLFGVVVPFFDNVVLFSGEVVLQKTVIGRGYGEVYRILPGVVTLFADGVSVK